MENPSNGFCIELFGCYSRELYRFPQLLPWWRSRQTHAILGQQEVDGTTGLKCKDLIYTKGGNPVCKRANGSFQQLKGAAYPWRLWTSIATVATQMGKQLGAVMHGNPDSQAEHLEISMLNRDILEPC